MLRKNGLVFMAVVMAGLAAGACSSDNDSDDVVQVDGRIALIDTNNDLVVDVNEWNAAFAVLDVNHDGVLTPAEFQFNSAAFTTVDVNRDGLVSVDEWDAAFRVLDINNDSVIEQAEFDVFL